MADWPEPIKRIELLMLLLKSSGINKETNNKQEIELSSKENFLKVLSSILIGALDTLESSIKVFLLEESALVGALDIFGSFKDFRREVTGEEPLNEQALLESLRDELIRDIIVVRTNLSILLPACSAT